MKKLIFSLFLFPFFSVFAGEPEEIGFFKGSASEYLPFYIKKVKYEYFTVSFFRDFFEINGEYSSTYIEIAKKMMKEFELEGRVFCKKYDYYGVEYYTVDVINIDKHILFIATGNLFCGKKSLF